MNSLVQALQNRFSTESIHVFSEENEIQLLTIELPVRSGIQVLMTNGLSNYQMPVPKKMQGQEFSELYFCLPSYWELNDENNEQFTWVISWIQRLCKHVIEKNTWFGMGHTIPAGKPPVSLSKTMKQNHFILSEPILLKEELKSITLESGKTIHFLAVIPIFEDEVDYKLGKSTYKFLKKLTSHGVSELLDDYRKTCLKSKWRF
jgi:hypothetical protein